MKRVSLNETTILLGLPRGTNGLGDQVPRQRSSGISPTQVPTNSQLGILGGSVPLESRCEAGWLRKVTGGLLYDGLGRVELAMSLYL